MKKLEKNFERQRKQSEWRFNMILMIDNYDSFTYNIFQYLSESTDEEIKVIRNDAITVKEAVKLAPSRLVISPGPGRPQDAGISMAMIKEFSGKIPILGVCLGHQCIGEVFGGKIVSSSRICHGKTDLVINDNKGIFRTIPKKAIFTRYHSLIIEKESLPEEFEISAVSNTDGEIMGIRHKQHDVEGVQFHPESIASEMGRVVLKNFLNYRREGCNIKELISKVMRGEDLSSNEIGSFMEELTEGNLNDAVIAGMLTALNTKGITADEIIGCASVLMRKKTPFQSNRATLDTCGTGGDGKGSFNISSMAALTAAAAGAAVAKHGNRAISSKSGSADFYEKLGIPTNLSVSENEQMLEDSGFAFLFAPLYHGAMRYAAAARKALGFKTIINLLGPLVNPAQADYQIIGVFSPEFLIPVAQAAKALGVKRVMTVHSLDGMDEISVSAPTKIITILEDNKIQETIFDPTQSGYPLYPIEDLAGGDANENSIIAGKIIEGNGSPAVKLAVTLNAGAALYLSKLANSIEEGEQKAALAIDNGKLKELIENLRKASKKDKP